MKGFVINECKGAKVKSLITLITSTDTDTMERVSADVLETGSRPDFFIQNGMKKKARLEANYYYELVEKISKEENIPILIRELPVLRQISALNQDKSTPFQERWIRLSWNSFFMDEGVHPFDPTYDRWNELQSKHFIPVNDWKSHGDYILFTLQLDGDSALNRLIYNNIAYKDYCCDIIRKIKSITDRPILIRSHPLDKTVVTHIKSVFGETLSYSDQPDLFQDFKRSYCMITYNSTSCVESALYGLPTITLDPSAVADPVSNSLEDLESLKEFDRDDWLQRIAFMQWKGGELSNGYVWNLLKSHM